MKKTFAAVVVALTISNSLMALKPVQTDGFNKYDKSIKLDLVSVGYLSPQIVWEHYTNTRFTYGVSVQAHFMNRSNAVRDNNENGNLPTQVTLDGKVYPLSWKDHPLNWYADVTMDDGTHEVKWDRKYVGAMVCPEGRFYMGRKPHRGFYFVARADVGVFREQFIVSNSTLNKEYINSLTAEQKEKDTRYLDYKDNPWHKANTEQGETFLAAGCGGGLGFQGWFSQNSHWGFDLNCFAKTDWKFSEDDNTWEWLWGVGSPLDFNASIIYRF